MIHYIILFDGEAEEFLCKISHNSNILLFLNSETDF